MTKFKSHILFLIPLILTLGCSSDTENEEPQIIPVVANFAQSASDIFVDETIDFTDNSTGNPTSWTWTFEGGTPGTSTLQNPSVQYTTTGSYDVRLVVRNAESSDEMVKQGVVTVDFDRMQGLILQVQLDGDAADTSGNANNGEIIGSVTPTASRSNAANAAMDFNQDDGYIEFGNIPELEIEYESSITISVWFNPNGNQMDWDTILNQFFQAPPPSAQGRFYIGINPFNQSVRWNVLGNQLESSNPIPINTWTHLVVTYANRKAQMYINGVLDGEITFGAGNALLGTGAPFRIGKQSMTGSNTSGFSGAIDDVYIFDRLLDDEEIQALYNED